MGCNYLSMPLIPASGWTLLIYAMGNFKVKSTSLYGKQLPVNQRVSLDCSVMITPSILFLAATKQLYIHFCLSDCLSVCLSVTPFSQCLYHCIIMKSSGVITIGKNDVHAKGQGQRSRSQRSKNILPPIWSFLDSYSSLNSQMAMKWFTNVTAA